MNPHKKGNRTRTSPLIVVQARMGSTRLPGKVLMNLAGEPLIVRMIERLTRINTPAKIVVAATMHESDDPLIEVCRVAGIDCFRGHPTDLLDRHYQAAVDCGAQVIAKIPSDCPLIDPQIIDAVFDRFAEDGSDYASNLNPASYPDGNDVEVMTCDALATARREASKSFEREHTTPFIWERPERFKVSNVIWEPRSDGSPARDLSMSHRWTIDYPEDYQFINGIYEELYARQPDFGLNDILQLLEREPKLTAINSKYAGVNWYRHHLAELNTVNAAQTRMVKETCSGAL